MNQTNKEKSTLAANGLPIIKQKEDLAKMRAKTVPVAAITSLVSILVFAGGGFLLDLFLDKKPLFFIIGFLIAFVVTDVVIIAIGKKVWRR
ncbi:MAG: AtpZ/AtpI family protein [bacterium]|nr:AtpZ/AtpI family protein [bacterium]